MQSNLTHEEEATERQEWIDYLPSILEAIEVGYLDEFLGTMQVKCMSRSKKVKPIRRGKSPAPDTDGSEAGQVNRNVGYEFHTPGTALPSQPDAYSRYSGNVVGEDDKVYRKSDVQVAGQRFVLSARWGTKYNGLVMKVVKINRTKAQCEVIGSERMQNSPMLHKTVTMPITGIITEIQRYNNTYGTR